MYIRDDWRVEVNSTVDMLQALPIYTLKVLSDENQGGSKVVGKI